MKVIYNNFYRYRKISSSNLLLLCLIIIFCAFKTYTVEAHYIENEENVESQVIDKDAIDSIINKDSVNEKNIGDGNTNKDIEDNKTDKELDAFKSLLNGLEMIKTEEKIEEEKNESNIGDIFNNLAFGLLNDIFDNKHNEISNNDKEKVKDRPKNQENITSNMIDNKLISTEGKIIDNKNTSEKEKVVDNKNTGEEEKKVDNKNISEKEKTIDNKNISKENKMANDNTKEEIKEGNNIDINNNPEENVKKIKLVTEHKTYQDDKNNVNQKSSNEDNVSDEDLKSFIKIFIEGDDDDNSDKKEIEDSLFKQAKEAIENSQSKNQNSNLDELAKAKEQALEKGPKFLKSSDNKNKQNMDNNDLNGVFKVEEAFIYKCIFDQECTNFKGFTPEIAYCNKTRRRCTNYCYVQKACLSDSDCSTTCGSWCLREDEMVFGKCVMSFEEGDFCMESWRVCGDGLFCNENTYVCEKTHIPLTFTRIDSQESLLSIIVFLIIAIYLIKKSRSNNFVTYFSGYSLSEYCNNVQEYDPLPEYQRTETLNPEEMNDLVEPPPETGVSSNVDEPGYTAGDDTEPLYCGYYDENNHSVNCNYIPIRHEEPIVNNNGEVNVRIPSVSSISDSNEIDEPPPDYEE